MLSFSTLTPLQWLPTLSFRYILNQLKIMQLHLHTVNFKCFSWPNKGRKGIAVTYILFHTAPAFVYLITAPVKTVLHTIQTRHLPALRQLSLITLFYWFQLLTDALVGIFTGTSSMYVAVLSQILSYSDGLSIQLNSKLVLFKILSATLRRSYYPHCDSLYLRLPISFWNIFGLNLMQINMISITVSGEVYHTRPS